MPKEHETSEQREKRELDEELDRQLRLTFPASDPQKSRDQPNEPDGNHLFATLGEAAAEPFRMDAVHGDPRTWECLRTPCLLCRGFRAWRWRPARRTPDRSVTPQRRQPWPPLEV
jgi:hypothetical protein